MEGDVFVPTSRRQKSVILGAGVVSFLVPDPSFIPLCHLPLLSQIIWRTIWVLHSQRGAENARFVEVAFQCPTPMFFDGS